MIDRTTVYLEKAQESVAGAQRELADGRNNNCANRAYYACFQAAVHALMAAGIRPPAATDRWGHEFVLARFNGDLINRRKLYPTDLRRTIELNFRLRLVVDYGLGRVSSVQAERAARRADRFVAAVAEREGRAS